MDVPRPLIDLTARWRAEAETLRRHGHESSARALEDHANDVEAAWRAHVDEELSIREAVELSGYTEDHLTEMCRKRKIAARKVGNEWRVKRRHLPRKATSPTRVTVEEFGDRLLEARRPTRT